MRYKFSFKTPTYGRDGNVVWVDVFSNKYVHDSTVDLLKEYSHNTEKQHDFKWFCEKLDDIIKWQAWSRYEYEFLLHPFWEDGKYEPIKMDAWQVCHENIETIAHRVIFVYVNKIMWGD